MDDVVRARKMTFSGFQLYRGVIKLFIFSFIAKYGGPLLHYGNLMHRQEELLLCHAELLLFRDDLMFKFAMADPYGEQGKND